MTLDSRSGGGKRPGKTEWAGRRRPATRSAGFKSHPDTTGGELQIALVSGWAIEGGGAVRVTFSFPAMEPGTLLGFGGWMFAPPEASVRLEGFAQKLTLTEPAAPDWSKFGSVWYSDGAPLTFSLVIETNGSEAEIALYDVQAGALSHDFYDSEKAGIEPERHARLMSNMWQFAPEAIFLSPDIDVTVSEPEVFGDSKLVEVVAWIYLKSCNRCARFLPINVDNERLQLSFSNHCVARHPCKHATFGRLTDIETDEVLETEYGFQLECRFCKKFTVNAQHNPQRSAAQMKEDAARRRAIETLLTALYEGSRSLSYRGESSGRELVDEVFARFEGRCFKCGTRLATAHDMHLDHTRPLALLWPLDGSATCLCATCNSAKRDRPPSEYYEPAELARLSAITGIPLEELQDPSPNRDAIARLAEQLDWFFDEFLQREDLQAVRDGKLPADLLVRALQKAINRSDVVLNLEEEYRSRGGMPG